jgi:hypothetical protein
LRTFLAEEPREALVAKAATRGERIVVMVAPVVGGLAAEGDRHRHLRHHGCPAPTDEAAVNQHDAASRSRRRDCRIHAGAARSNDQDFGFGVHGLMAHAGAPRCSSTSLLAAGEGREPAASECDDPGAGGDRGGGGEGLTRGASRLLPGFKYGDICLEEAVGKI